MTECLNGYTESVLNLAAARNRGCSEFLSFHSDLATLNGDQTGTHFLVMSRSKPIPAEFLAVGRLVAGNGPLQIECDLANVTLLVRGSTTLRGQACLFFSSPVKGALAVLGSNSQQALYLYLCRRGIRGNASLTSSVESLHCAMLPS